MRLLQLLRITINLWPLLAAIFGWVLSALRVKKKEVRDAEEVNKKLMAQRDIRVGSVDDADRLLNEIRNKS